MTDDFDIIQVHGQWQVVATGPRGKAFASADPRFKGGKAELEPDDVVAVYQELHDKGYFPRVPNGLPAVGRDTVFPRMALLLAAIVIPLVIFVLLV